MQGAFRFPMIFTNHRHGDIWWFIVSNQTLEQTPSWPNQSIVAQKVNALAFIYTVHLIWHTEVHII